MHFTLCFPFSLLCLFQHIWPISLSNLILVILSLQTDFTFLLVSFPLFTDHTLGDKTNEVIMIGAHRPGQQRSYRRESIDKEAYAHEFLEALRSRQLPLPHGHWPRPSPPRWTNRFRIMPEPLPRHWEAFLNQLQLTIFPYG